MNLEETDGTFLAVQKATERATTGVDHLSEYIQVPHVTLASLSDDLYDSLNNKNIRFTQQ
jgi:hypothetical protein